LGGLLGAVVAETGARSVAALGGAVGTVGAAALGVLVWNAQLRRRVRRATSRLGARNAELRRSGEQMHAVLHSMTSLVVEVTPSGRIRRVVPTNYEFKRHRPEELEGRHYTEFVPALAVEAVAAALGEAARTRGGAHCEFEIDLDARRCFNVNITALRQDRLLAVCRDVTELRRSERKYRELVQLANCVILRLDTQGRVIFFNDFAERFFGWPRRDILGRPVLGSLVPERDAAGLDLAALLRDLLLDPGAHPQMESENLCRDGRRVWVEWSNRPVYEDGVLAGVLCVGNDVTQRKIAQRELADREHYFRSLIEFSSDLITVVDEQGDIVFESPAVRACLGIDPEALPGDALERHIHPDDAGLVRGVLGRLGSGSGAPQRFEYRRRTAAGGWRHLEAHAVDLLDDPVVGGVVVNSRDVTERKAFERELRQQIFHDSLTGLPNRVLFLEHLKQAMERMRRRDGYAFAVLLINIDRFKLVNDGLGRGVGDELLIQVAERLGQCLRKVDTVARLGSDEFVLLLDEVDDDRVPMRAAERIQQVVSRPMRVAGEEMSVTVGMGIVYSSREHQDAEQVLRDADAAVHRAKTKGCGVTKVFHSRMHVQALGLLKMEMDLRRALERDEFRVHYQPFVDLASGRVQGVEALIRWMHPERGMILPGEFIPLAEETGLIVPLGEWVLRRACLELAELGERCAAGREIQMAVNLSARQFTEPDLAVRAQAIAAETGVSPSRVKLEVTESMLMHNPDEVAVILAELKSAGFSLAIDDFGTGYSSLASLHRYPFDTLKIDRSFVSRISSRNGVDSRKIIQTILGLAASLDLRTIAEGIETEAQRRVLRQLGCDVGQGFHFSRPVDAEGMRRLLMGERPEAAAACEPLGVAEG
ncbi:MAG: EAL domain-containing protein, partial [Desulfovibrionaceae bacterium]